MSETAVALKAPQRVLVLPMFIIESGETIKDPSTRQLIRELAIAVSGQRVENADGRPTGLRVDRAGAALLERCVPILGDYLIRDQQKQATELLENIVDHLGDTLAAFISFDPRFRSQNSQLWEKYEKYKREGRLPQGEEFYDFIQAVHLQLSQITSGIIGEAKAYYLCKKGGLEPKMASIEQDIEGVDMFIKYEHDDGTTHEYPVQVKARQEPIGIRFQIIPKGNNPPLVIVEFGLPKLFDHGRLGFFVVREAFDPKDYQIFLPELSKALESIKIKKND